MLGHKEALETQVGEDVKLVFSVLPSPICSSWWFWRISTSACAGGGSLPLCLAPLQLPFLSSVLWKVRRSKRQLCARRCWAGVKTPGGDGLPWAEALLRDQMPSLKRSRKRNQSRDGWDQGSLRRRSPCCLSWALGCKACRGEVPGPPPPPHLCLSAFSIHRRRCGVCDNDTQILGNNPAQCRHLLRMWG